MPVTVTRPVGGTPGVRSRTVRTNGRPEAASRDCAVGRTVVTVATTRGTTAVLRLRAVPGSGPEPWAATRTASR